MAFQFYKKDPDHTPNPWNTRTRTVVYDNPWIQVTHREVVNPSGGNGIYGVVHFKNTAVGIVPLDSEGNTWLIGQYRYTINQYCWEIPEGGGAEGTDLLEAAQRELLEETGIRADTWIPLLETHLSNSVSDEYGVAYIARGLHFGQAEPEETEQLQVRKLPFSQAVEMVIAGEITDVLSQVSILKTHHWLEQGIIKF